MEQASNVYRKALPENSQMASLVEISFSCKMKAAWIYKDL